MNLFTRFHHTKTVLSIIVFSVPVLTSSVMAQPMIVSTVPDSGATGISPSAAVVFTFSEAMDTNATSAQFFSASPFAILATSSAWSSGDTVLTCTPTPPFPANNTIFWSMTGQNPAGDPISGNASDFFSTGGPGGGGSGTNSITTFSVGKVHLFDQTSAAAPVADSLTPYDFTATTTLASNRTASSITLTLPTGAISNVTQNPLHPEQFYLFDSKTNLSSFDITFPTGTYTFTVTGSSNQTVPLNLSASLTQPNAPYLTNFNSAQAVNVTQPFLLSWDGFSGGTSADFISVKIGNAFSTAAPGAAGALTGTATSVSIPANTLQANSNYDSAIGFYRALVSSNATFSTIAYIATVTHFTLNTSSGSPVTIVLTNAAWMNGMFSFDVLAPSGQTLTVEYSPTLRPNSWGTVLTTNAPAAGRIQISDPHSTTNRSLGYRARTGS